MRRPSAASLSLSSSSSSPPPPRLTTPIATRLSFSPTVPTASDAEDMIAYSFTASEYDLRHRSIQLADLALLADDNSINHQSNYSDDNDEIEEIEEEISSLPLSPTERTTILIPRQDTSPSNYGTIPQASSSPTTTTTNLRTKFDLFNSFTILLGYLPAVALGLMMNVLDGVSYGLIMFPTSNSSTVFEGLGGIGISMFFMTCIISQLVYSLGASGFKGGNGSMMIESVPFMHVIAKKIADGIGNVEGNYESILATTLFAFAFSSILTGLAFFSLGAFKLGTLMGFFPRHILVGCIGSVGVFLLITGLQVTSQFTEPIGFNIIQHLYETHILLLWIIPLTLALLLRFLSTIITHPFFVPLYFILIPLIFYIITFSFHLPLNDLREKGWIFNLPKSSSSVNNNSFEFYKLYKFNLIDWKVFKKTLTAQFAMVIFGLLHVPLNVPALSLSLRKDDVDIDRELIAHGISNTLAGLTGTVSNYLCYVNSVLFVRVGGDSRAAGVLLAGATLGVFLIGPGAIAFLPVCVVGALIFLLGIDLVKEAVWDTIGKVSWTEYGTIWAIIIAATWHDFVVGLVVGIVLACLSFVVTVSQHRAIRSVMDGRIARSTVRRHPTQHAFLKRVGSQTRVIKLQGHLFFGTISITEKTIKGLLLSTDDQISHLLLDFSSVATVDFSGVEGFIRIERLLFDKDIILVICGASECVRKALRVWTRKGVEVFENLNQALEFCENVHLRSLYPIDALIAGRSLPSSLPLGLDKSRLQFQQVVAPSPRNELRLLAAQDVMASVGMSPSTGHHHRVSHQPIHLLVQTFKPFLPELGEEFWRTHAPLFTRIELECGKTVWEQGSEPDCFYLIESGILRAKYNFNLEESMLPGTIAGDQSFLSEINRNTKVIVESNLTILWKMNKNNWNENINIHSRELISKGMLRMSAFEEDVLVGHLLSRV
ncbi:hypothetical protein CROQUDRAFT_663465 [Cronartium quercuum f. sp. fusiforme G11]|uniref:Sulfate transporter n=1 Tax=Cronartium quercuum f. sp. fusiforme G11 TaxID=708437 RepID=A0A9P6T7L5_9BASI|nr:hypothetical protein CROQUDRAFT_663465 [Cronartium quercuum f. sp. fusiforme G11]